LRGSASWEDATSIPIPAHYQPPPAGDADVLNANAMQSAVVQPDVQQAPANDPACWLLVCRLRLMPAHKLDEVAQTQSLQLQVA